MRTFIAAEKQTRIATAIVVKGRLPGASGGRVI
jgi:hypothetical protein